MIDFLYDLTISNWGFTWHIVLGDVLTTIVLVGVAYFFWKKKRTQPYLWYVGITFLIVNAVGYVNEFVQQDQSEFWQDMIANNIGFVLGVIKVSVVAWFENNYREF